MKIIGGKYAEHTGTVESDMYQRTVDYPDEWNNGYHIWLYSEELVTVRREQVEGMRWRYRIIGAAHAWEIARGRAWTGPESAPEWAPKDGEISTKVIIARVGLSQFQNFWV